MYHPPVKGAGRERRDELGNFNKAYRTQPHRGSDWGFKTGSAGKPVYAVADGVVSDNFWTDALGHCITVKNTHDEVFVLFAHLEEKSPIKKGTKVIGGETELGKIGNTGSASAGAHLHAAASKSPKPHLASFPALLDLFKLIDADKPEKPEVAEVAKPKKAPAKEKERKVKLWSKVPKRLKRVAALSLGAGLSSMGVGNLPLFNMAALESVLFGASVAIVGLVMGLSFTYAGKGEVPDKDFDNHINATIESVQSKNKKD